MTKVNISRILDVGQYLATQAGQQLQGALTALADFMEVGLRCLRNGLTFRDNFSCEIRTVSLLTNTETVIDLVSNKHATAITFLQSIDNTYWVLGKKGWKYNDKGQIVIAVEILSSAGVALPVGQTAPVVIRAEF